MITNLERYRKDLETLLTLGVDLVNSLSYRSDPATFRALALKTYGSEVDKFLKDLPNFNDDYQRWYSEAREVVKQLLPDRLTDFVRLYEKPKTRKEINFENYRVEDALQGLRLTRNNRTEVIVDDSAAIPHLKQQVAILYAVKGRFESSLFDIRQMVQADLFDSELETASALAKSGFSRSAGALAGVVLERHLQEVCRNHNINVRKTNPGISALNDAIKEANVSLVPQWRRIQLLGDLRNLCDHSKDEEPTKEQVAELVDGVGRIVKTLF